MIIDDKLPINRNDNKTMMSDKSENEAWYPALLEKAFAKYYGNYVKINGGDYTESLRALTGGAIVKMNMTAMNDKEIFENISKNGNDTNPMLASAFADHEGLKKDTIYYIIGALNVTQKIAKPKVVDQLIQLQNPNDKKTFYTGPWNDGDAKWTKKLKKALNLTLEEDDGMFFMPVEDFKKAFNKFTIAQQNTTTIKKTLFEVVTAQTESKFYLENGK